MSFAADQDMANANVIGNGVNNNNNNVIENKKGISIANRRVGFDVSSLGLQTCTDFFMVAPGISPSELLASPVMLPNAQVFNINLHMDLLIK